jgi:hypothetical protein
MKEATVLGVIGGATALAIVGLTWSGWLIESNRKLATQRADTAGVVAVATNTVCACELERDVMHLAGAALASSIDVVG